MEQVQLLLLLIPVGADTFEHRRNRRPSQHGDVDLGLVPFHQFTRAPEVLGRLPLRGQVLFVGHRLLLGHIGKRLECYLPPRRSSEESGLRGVPVSPKDLLESDQPFLHHCLDGAVEGLQAQVNVCLGVGAGQHPAGA